MTDTLTPAKKTSVLIPLTVAGGLFMEGLDSTALGTALPQVAQSLDVSPPVLSLTLTAYLLSLAMFIPVSGWIADRFGARRVYGAAIVIFTVSSVLCGLAHNLPILVLTRILQGLGGAMMTPVGRLILARAFPKAELIKAMNYMVLPALTGPMLGPVVGGLAVTYLSWRWIFFINVPVGIIGLLMTLRLIDDESVPRPPPFDFRGFLLVGIGLACAQFAIDSLGRGFIPPAGEASLLLTAAAAVTLYIAHARRVPAPVMDLSTLKIRTFAVSILSGGVSRIPIGAAPFLMPLLFQVGFGMNPLHSGVLMLVSYAGSFAMRIGNQRLYRWLGLRNILILNAMFIGLMTIGFAFLHADTPRWILFPYVGLYGFLRTLQFSTLGALSYAELSPEAMSNANTLFVVGQRLSMGAGIGIAAALLAIFGAFAPVFVTLGLVEIASLAGFLRLQAADGTQLTGHRLAEE